MSKKLIDLGDTLPAIFIERENRFVCTVELDDGTPERVHLADPGRLKELLYPGNGVLIQRATGGTERKTRFSLVSAWGGDSWILINTAFHRRIATAVLEDPTISPFGSLVSYRAEVTSPVGRSRFDFRLDLEDSTVLWLEVKGCTLSADGRALFPDAPTERGRRHLRELTEIALAPCVDKAGVMFLIFVQNVEYLAPNRETDSEFADALVDAITSGVEVHGIGLELRNGIIQFASAIPVLTD